jgi:hypothetical protein
MALPKVEHPIYPIYLKSLDRKVKFRPFLVKEEKILLMAKESKDIEEVRLAIKQIIQNCVLEDIDVEALPLFDVEMAFLKLRAKSVGESVRLVFNCQNEVDGAPCNTDTNYTINLEKVDFEIPEGHDPKVMITDTLGIKLKYPTLGLNMNIEEDEEAFVIILRMVLQNIEYIFDNESIYKPEDTPEQELMEFLENLTPENLTQIQHFFNTAPKVVLDDKVSCKKCGYEHTIHTEDLIGFFI